MKRIVCLFLLLCILPVMPVSAEEKVFTVSLDGSGDYKTMYDALVAARGYGGSCTILVEEGIYSFSSTLELIELDRDITIRAREGAKVLFTGGNSFSFDAFEPVTDSDVLERIVSESGRRAVVQVKLSDVGITDYGKMKIQGFLSSNDNGYSPTLTLEGTTLPLACYPNGAGNYLMCTEVLEDGSNNPNVLGSLREIKIKLNSDRYRYWEKAEDIWSLGYLCHDWADSTVPVTFDQQTGVMSGYVGKNYYAKVNRRIKFFNLLEELDEPGEWYLDRKTGILYLIPPVTAKEGDVLTFTSTNKNLVSVTKSKNITFEGITFTGTTAYGAYLKQAEGILFDNCEFSSIGNAAVYMNQCYRSGVRDSYFHDLGSWGVYLHCCGDRETLTPGECFVENSEFERFSQYRRTYSPAVHMYEDVGNRVSHCEFHDAPHFAIRYDSNDNVIEYSEFYDLCQETADTGAVYTGRYWNTRGNEIRYNYFHDLYLGSTPTSGLYGVYLDDAHSSTDVHHNIFYKVSTVSLMGGGRNNSFTNNMIVDCGANLIFDARCISWMDWGEGSGIRNNTNKIKNWQTAEVWSKYPNLQDLYQDEEQYPKYNLIQNNISLNTPNFKINEYVTQYGTVRENAFIKDTAVVKDYQNKDFSPVKQAASIAKIENFDPIPMEQIGLQRKVKPSGKEPKSRQQSKMVYYEDFQGYTNNEFNGTVISTPDSVTLRAGWVLSDGMYRIPATRQKKTVNVPVTKERNYRLKVTYSATKNSGDDSEGLFLLNGLVFDQSGFSYLENGKETAVASNEFYYYPEATHQRRSLEKVYSYDRSMHLTQLFFLIQATTWSSEKDVWDGGVQYSIHNFSITEETTFHQLLFRVNEGGKVYYSNRDKDGLNQHRMSEIEQEGLVEAEEGTSPELTVIPEEGYQLAMVQYPNGEFIQYNSEDAVTLTMSDISQSGNVIIYFVKGEDYSQKPGLAAPTCYVFTRDGREFTLPNGQGETGPEFYFYSAANGFSYTEDSEAGFLFGPREGRTHQLPVTYKNGKTKPVTPGQRFGIKVFGPGVTYETEYTATPYVREGEQTVAGDEIVITEQ